MATPVKLASEAGRAPRLGSIEACRGIAAIMVAVYHSGVILNAPANLGFHPFGALSLFGRSGVDFFFVLSGFLISMIHLPDLGHHERLRHYARRRLTRIYPTYWFVLAALIPFDIFTHTLFDDYNRPWEVVKAIFLIPQEHTIVDVTWSLRNELLFYALFGLTIFNRRIGMIVGALWVVALVARQFIAPVVDSIWIALAADPMNFEFLAGVAAGWVFRKLPVSRPFIPLIVGILTFVVLWAAEDFGGWSRLPPALMTVRCLGYGVAAALTIIGLSGLERHGRIKVPAPLVTLGGASYLLYLLHVPALLVLGASERHLHLLRFVPGWLIAGILVAFVVVGSVIVHVLVEKPMLNAIRGRRRGESSVASTPAAA